jgi:hypothetical protein
MSSDFVDEKDVTKEFQSDLIDIFQLCNNHGTDRCTLELDYPSARIECDFTFRIIPKKKTILRGDDDEQK